MSYQNYQNYHKTNKITRFEETLNKALCSYQKHNMYGESSLLGYANVFEAIESIKV